jgi:hypothetical protein
MHGSFAYFGDVLARASEGAFIVPRRVPSCIRRIGSACRTFRQLVPKPWKLRLPGGHRVSIRPGTRRPATRGPTPLQRVHEPC